MRIFDRLLPEVRSAFTREIVPEKTQRYYEDNPFPYFTLDDYPTFDDLKRTVSSYIRQLDQAIPADACILDAGCGTGQHGIYLAHLPRRRIVGTDFSQNSLYLAQHLKEQLGFSNIEFLQSDIFKLPLKTQSFDVVLCHGVLHHTPSPRDGLQCLVELLKPGGILVLGLYHRLGRRKLWRDAARIQEDSDCKTQLDSFYRTKSSSKNPHTKHSWFINMYLHPGESGLLFQEIAEWFGEMGLVVAGCLPKFHWYGRKSNTMEQVNTLTIDNKHSKVKWIYHDFRMWLKPVENGYFLIFGRKRS